MDRELEQIKAGIETAFIDYKQNSDPTFTPQFISNDYRNGVKLLSVLENDLRDCDEFFISVAFITQSGIEPLLQVLKELENKNIRGRILTTNYLNFSEPKALEKLNSFKNIEVRMYVVREKDPGFHTKGYLFRNDQVYKIIIGSSNMTGRALSVNKEWNTKIVATINGAYVRETCIEFESLWDNALPLGSWIETYKDIYRKQKEIAIENRTIDLVRYTLEPNEMQVSFTNNLKKLVDKGEKRALLISATATGKTYASAFAVRELMPQKVLFLVHREQILQKALESYKNVFGNEKSYSLLSGSQQKLDTNFIFAMVQTINKSSEIEKYSPDEFDVIVIDEVHRAGANTYQKIMEYFKPKLYLGMTATPERTDGFDIYELFDHNIAYEIRLNSAMEENLLCPFHYFGISELIIDGKIVDDSRLDKFNYLTSDSRVNHIIDKIEYYGYSGYRAKGLIFCSRIEEAKILSQKFNELGYKTATLSGSDSIEVREELVNRLTSDNRDDFLQYIFTVDIFNEGVDIPEINQVILLRPTQSPIIFVQQIGRGLRKHDSKEFVVILDFIGNYKNNYMIPIALFGDRSYNKDNMRKYVSGGTRLIPGTSSIHFDEISRKMIYESIDKANTSDVKLIMSAYMSLKQRLGRIPKMLEFAEFGSIDINNIFDKFGSYHSFLKNKDKDYLGDLPEEAETILKYISQKLAKGKRLHEIFIIKSIIELGTVDRGWIDRIMKECMGIDIKEEDFKSAVRVLNYLFLPKNERERLKGRVLSDDGNADTNFLQFLKLDGFNEYIHDLLKLAMESYRDNYSNLYKNTNFALYKKYTYEEVCRILNWDTKLTALNIGGYTYNRETKTLPVFINYEKKDDAIAYEDRFVNNQHLIALSKKYRGRNSVDADHIFKRTPEDKDNKIYLFVRKNKEDIGSKEFYFLGEMNATGEPIETTMNNDIKVFEIKYILDKAVRDDVYEYIVGE